MCKTHYVISQDTKADRIYLAKTKDMNHCQEKVVRDIGLTYAEKCPECQAVSTTFLTLLVLFCGVLIGSVR